MKRRQIRPVEALIFDMDGLLTDTERLHMRAFQMAFREYDIEVSDEKYIEHWIRGGKSTRLFLEEIGSSATSEAVQRTKAIYFEKMLKKDLKAMPGAEAILKRFHGVLPLAVGSSSWEVNVLLALKGTGLYPYFDVIVSGNDVVTPKPHPDIFLMAAEKLKLAPQVCLVLEDAEKGIVAAKRADMMSLAIPTEYTMQDDFSDALGVFESLEQAGDWIEEHRKR